MTRERKDQLIVLCYVVVIAFELWYLFAKNTPLWADIAFYLIVVCLLVSGYARRKRRRNDEWKPEE